MKNQMLAVEIGTDATRSTEQAITPDSFPEEILSFSHSSDTQPEDLLPEIINDDEVIYNAFWCDTVRALIRKQPTSLTRYDWMDICVRLVDVIEGVANKRPPACASTETMARPISHFQRTSQTIFDQTEEQAAAPPAVIPFEIGLQLLRGGEPDMGEQTREAVRALQAQALPVDNRDGEILMLRQRLSHWKALAQSRLEQMRRDMDFRRRIVLGQWSERQTTEAL
jgi:hypothetical protein